MASVKTGVGFQDKQPPQKIAFLPGTLEEMLSSVVAACPGSTKNAVESKAPYALILTSDVLTAWEKPVQQMKD